MGQCGDGEDVDVDASVATEESEVCACGGHSNAFDASKRDGEREND